MAISVTILGCGSALPTLWRNATAQVVNVNTKPYLVDCAEATQVQLYKTFSKTAAINQLFISHLHGDHFFGVFGLLSSFALMGRKTPFDIFCNDALRQMLTSTCSPVNLNDLGFEVRFHQLQYDSVHEIYSDKQVTVYSFPLKHRISVCGFLFREKQKQPNIIKECISKYNLSIAEIVSIKNGSDLYLENGSVVPNSELTIAPAKPLSYAFVTDTLALKSIVPIIEGVDLLYHEATYEHALAERAKQTYHSTTIQAAEIARDAHVGKLIIGHYSGRYHEVDKLVKEARTVFPKTFAAQDCAIFNVENNNN